MRPYWVLTCVDVILLNSLSWWCHDSSCKYMHQHYKAAVIEYIRNMNIFIELTLSLLFALLPNQFQITCVCVILYARCALNCEAIRHLSHSKNLKLESSREAYSLSSAGPSSLCSGMDMWMCYEADNGGYSDCLHPGQGCPSVERAPALSQSDWRMGRSEQSLKMKPVPAKGLRPARSLSISHIILLVPACSGHCLGPHKAS